MSEMFRIYEHRQPSEVVDDQGPFDSDELARWAETYGHPETWAKKAQAAHQRAEVADEAKDRWMTRALEAEGALEAVYQAAHGDSDEFLRHVAKEEGERIRERDTAEKVEDGGALRREVVEAIAATRAETLAANLEWQEALDALERRLGLPSTGQR